MTSPTIISFISESGYLLKNFKYAWIVKRGLFSGSVGYISPAGDFDFNVVIRSILYNEIKKYISVSVGSAITIRSNEKAEYKECEIKAKAMLKALNANVKEV